MTYIWGAWLFGALLFYTFAEYSSKLFSNTTALKWAFLAWVGYSINVFFWLGALKSKNELAIISTFLSIAYVISSVILGYVIFGETITIKQWIGIILAICAIALLV